MKVLLFLMVTLGMMGAEGSTAAKIPAVLHLTGGAVLRGVTIERWEKDRVVIRYTGGLAPIPFTNIAEPDRTAVLTARDAQAASPPQPAANKGQTVTGQVFVTTRGAGSYKFSGAVVAAYPMVIWERCAAAESANLPLGYRRLDPIQQTRAESEAWLKAVNEETQLASATTDADGNFKLTLPSRDPVFIVCSTTRLVGKYSEWNIWALQITSDEVFLNSNNQWVQPP